jgi:hypothetical protein
MAAVLFLGAIYGDSDLLTQEVVKRLLGAITVMINKNREGEPNRDELRKVARDELLYARRLPPERRQQLERQSKEIGHDAERPVQRAECVPSCDPKLLPDGSPQVVKGVPDTQAPGSKIIPVVARVDVVRQVIQNRIEIERVQVSEVELFEPGQSFAISSRYAR